MPFSAALRLAWTQARRRGRILYIYKVDGEGWHIAISRPRQPYVVSVEPSMSLAGLRA